MVLGLGGELLLPLTCFQTSCALQSRKSIISDYTLVMFNTCAGRLEADPEWAKAVTAHNQSDIYAWFQSAVLHVWLCLGRMYSPPVEGRELMSQEMSEHLFNEVERRFIAMGVTNPFVYNREYKVIGLGAPFVTLSRMLGRNWPTYSTAPVLRTTRPIKPRTTYCLPRYAFCVRYVLLLIPLLARQSGATCSIRSLRNSPLMDRATSLWRMQRCVFCSCEIATQAPDKRIPKSIKKCCCNTAIPRHSRW
jgi:hypothetical protein